MAGRFGPKEFLTAERAECELGMLKFRSTEGAECGCNKRAIGTDAVDNDDYGSGDEAGEFGRGGRKAKQIVGRLAQGDADLLEDFQGRRRTPANDIAEVPGSKTAEIGGSFVGQALVLQDLKNRLGKIF